MAQILVRNLDDEVKERLKNRAVTHGISMEAEARLILMNALKIEKQLSPGLGSSISNRFAKQGLEEPLPELHGESIPSMDL